VTMTITKLQQLTLHCKWNRLVHRIKKFYITLIFGRWERVTLVKIWEKEHPITYFEECDVQ